MLRSSAYLFVILVTARLVDESNTNVGDVYLSDSRVIISDDESDSERLIVQSTAIERRYNAERDSGHERAQ